MAIMLTGRVVRLSRAHWDDLYAIRLGADIHAPAIARRLRSVERRYPELLSIGELQMYKGSGVGVVPYFGAVLTPVGRRLVRYYRKVNGITHKRTRTRLK